jgi:hypothetical protein
MSNAAFLREQIESAHEFLEEAMQDVTNEQLHWEPPGSANPIGATYAHVVMGEDLMVNGLVRGISPLFYTTFAGKFGLSEPPPMPNQGDWDAWARKVKVDLPALREYAMAVYANTDDYLAALDDAELNREIDLSIFEMGQRSLSWFLGNIVLSHVSTHCGEISCLKGLQTHS